MRGGAVAIVTALIAWGASAAAVVVPDDYSTIQAAIDAVPPGSIVEVRPGTYPEALLVQGKSITIAGLGGRPVIAPGPTAKGIVARARGEYVELDLTGIDVVGARVGVIAKAIAQVNMYSVVVSGCGRGAILKADGVILREVTIADSLTGLGLQATASDGGPWVHDGVFTNNAGGGAKIKNPKGGNSAGIFEVLDGVFSDNGKFGLFVISGFGGRIARNEMSRNAGAGVVVRVKDRAPTIEDNTADDNGTYGFDLDDGGTEPILWTEPSLLSLGNTAAGNGVLDFLLK